MFLLLDMETKSFIGLYNTQEHAKHCFELIKQYSPTSKIDFLEIVPSENKIKNITNCIEANVDPLHFPKEMKNQIQKLQDKYNMFIEEKKTFDKLLNDKVISLDNTDMNTVPDLFRDKFEIFKNITRNGLLPEKQFDYFCDAYIEKNIKTQWDHAFSP